MANKVMVREYPQDQRLAVCHSSWDAKRGNRNISVENKSPAAHAVLKEKRTRASDPTNTLPIRNRFARAMRSRFDRLAKLIRKAVYEEDCFGLRDRENMFIQAEMFMNAETPGPRAFEFKQSGEKIEEFSKWLNEVMNDEVLEVTSAADRERAETSIMGARRWTDDYIHSSYQRGVADARSDLIKQGVDIPEFEGIDQQGQYIGTAFNQKAHVDRLGEVYARTYSDLKGITSNLDTQISRILAQGLADGDNPLKLARKLRKITTGDGKDLGIKDSLGRYIPAKRRAEMLARTEAIRACAEANLREYEECGIKKVEWVFGGVNSCEYCESMHGQQFTIKEAQGMIPAHPMCGCGWVAVVDVPGEDFEEGLDEESREFKAGENKQRIYDAWLRGEVDPAKLAQLAGGDVKDSTIRGWLNKWKRGQGLPAGRKAGEAPTSAPEPKPEPKPKPRPEPKPKPKTKVAPIPEFKSKFDDMSVNDLKKYLKDKGVTFKGNLSNKDLDSYREMARFLDRFDRALQGKSLKDIVRKIELGDIGGGSGGTYNPSTKTITLDGKMLGRNFDTKIGGGRWGVSDSLVGVLGHEVGHGYWDKQLPYKEKSKFKNLYNKLGKAWFKKNISKYGASSFDEAFAECFAYYVKTGKDFPDAELSKFFKENIPRGMVTVPKEEVEKPKARTTKSTAKLGEGDEFYNMDRNQVRNYLEDLGIEVTGNMSRASLSSCQEMARYLDRLSKGVGGANEFVKSLVFDKISKRTSGQYTSGVKVIELNPSVLRDGTNVQIGKGNWGISMNYVGILAHECGHGYWYNCLNSRNKAEFERIYNEKGKDWFKKNITGYGATRIEEAFAEAFAYYTLTGKKMPGELNDYFKKIVPDNLITVPKDREAREAAREAAKEAAKEKAKTVSTTTGEKYWNEQLSNKAKTKFKNLYYGKLGKDWFEKNIGEASSVEAAFVKCFDEYLKTGKGLPDEYLNKFFEENILS
jgi:SPP1 gp7 family putative phage head morphogenesis protein